MTAESAAVLRTFAFGDLDAGVWGAAWFAPPGIAALLALGAGLDADAVVGELEAGPADGRWEARSEHAQLSLAPAGPAVAAGEGGGFDQLCHVSGRFDLGDAHLPVDCLGVRTARSQPFDVEKVDSIRAVSAWFDPADGLALLALRPRGNDGQEQDRITAAVLDEESAAPAADPRLSTTYARDGRPTRTGIELWLEDENEEQAYLRRAAGERIGSLAAAATGAFSVEAEPFRFHSRGREGAGVYLLARHT